MLSTKCNKCGDVDLKKTMTNLKQFSISFCINRSFMDTMDIITNTLEIENLKTSKSFFCACPRERKIMASCYPDMLILMNSQILKIIVSFPSNCEMFIN